MMTVQEQIVSTLDHSAENAMEAELQESGLESCKKAYLHVGKCAKGKAASSLSKFEQALISEYAKINAQNFLPDGKVNYAELMERIHKKYGYEGFEISDAIQQLKESKIGMISMSRGHDKMWIQIKEMN